MIQKEPFLSLAMAVFPAAYLISNLFFLVEKMEKSRRVAMICFSFLAIKSAPILLLAYTIGVYDLEASVMISFIASVAWTIETSMEYFKFPQAARILCACPASLLLIFPVALIWWLPRGDWRVAGVMLSAIWLFAIGTFLLGSFEKEPSQEVINLDEISAAVEAQK